MFKQILKATIIICLATLCFGFFGCETKPKAKNTLVAAIGPELMVSVNTDGTVNAIKKDLNIKDYDFSNWVGIRSVSSNELCIGGIREDGSVVLSHTVLDISDSEFGISDWKDIEMLEFSAFNVYGLKSDGTIEYFSLFQYDKTDDINENINNWTDIDYIDGSYFGVVGVKKNGKVVAALDLLPELEEKIKNWEDIKMASISSYFFRARIVGLKNNGELVEARYSINEESNYQLDPYNELKGAEKICAGDMFTAGLMPNGTLRVICGRDYDYQAKVQQEGIDYIDIKALDNTEDVIDINSFEDHLVVLKRDGTILYAGFFEDKR